MKATAICHKCDWLATGAHADVDKAASAHIAKTGHPTAVMVMP